MKSLLKCLAIIVITICALLVITIAIIPKPPLLQNISFSQAVYDKQQHLLRLTLSKDDKYRLFTPLNEISPLVIQATLLQEDQYFYQHPGINPISLVKATWRTYFTADRRVGASTITMQMARMRFGINSKTISGKLLQIARAIQLERFYSKDQILEAYLNLASYGGNIEGVGAASLIYFDKPAQQLTLPEALTLAVIPQNPLERSPKSPLAPLFQRGGQKIQNAELINSRNQLYQRWLTKHPKDINQKSLISLPLQTQSIKQIPYLAPHFVDAIIKNQNPNITTTINIKLQKIIETTTRQYIKQKQILGISNAAIMLVDTRNMEVKALLGSANFFDPSIEGQVNGTLAKRSPGSTLKPFIYALAIDQGLIHPYSMLKDAPTRFGNYNPENFDQDFIGPIKAKDALELSRNIPAIYLASQLKNPTLYQFLQQANITDLKPEAHYGLSLVLGGGETNMQELVGLYAMLANGGIWQPLRMQITDPITNNKRLSAVSAEPYAMGNPKGRIAILPFGRKRELDSRLAKYNQEAIPAEKAGMAERLLSPEASFLTLDMLKDNKQNNRLPMYWKTGTSSGFRDAWTIGVFGPYVLAVWIGNFDASSNPAFVGKDAAAPLFLNIANAIATQTGPLPSVLPDPKKLHLVQTEVCEASGMLPTRFCPNKVKTWFIPGKSPIKTDTIFREIAIDSKTGFRACHFDKNITFQVYEFWPSDLLKIFQQAGVQRRVPPAYDPGCDLNQQAIAGLAPHITSPQSSIVYTLSLNAKQKTFIPFSAIGDADIKNFYWFANETFIGKTARDKTLFWPEQVGNYTIRVVDDRGRSDVVSIQVKNS